MRNKSRLRPCVKQIDYNKWLVVCWFPLRYGTSLSVVIVIVPSEKKNKWIMEIVFGCHLVKHLFWKSERYILWAPLTPSRTKGTRRSKCIIDQWMNGLDFEIRIVSHSHSVTYPDTKTTTSSGTILIKNIALRQTVWKTPKIMSNGKKNQKNNLNFLLDNVFF